MRAGQVGGAGQGSGWPGCRGRGGGRGGDGRGCQPTPVPTEAGARAAGPLCIADYVRHCDGGCASSTATPGCRPPDSHPLRLPPHGQQQFPSRVCPSSPLLHSGASVCTGDTCSGWGVQGRGTDHPCGSLSVDRWLRSRSPLCLLSQPPLSPVPEWAGFLRCLLVFSPAPLQFLPRVLPSFPLLSPSPVMIARGSFLS